MKRLFVTAGLLASLFVAAAPAHAALGPIQQAVNAASPGGTVSIGRGTFVEEVVINKNLTLKGAGVDATVIQAPTKLTKFGTHQPDGRAVTAIVRVGRGARVEISRLTVRGPIPCDTEVTGVQALQGATLNFHDARVTAIQVNPATCAPQNASGRAIVYGIPSHIDVGGVHGSTAFGTVSRVQVDRFQHAGITATGPVSGGRSRLNVVQSTVSGGWVLPSFQTDIWVSDGVVVNLSQNTITGAVCGGPGCGPDPIFNGQGIGVFILGIPPGSVVAGNQISGNEVGINQLFSPNCCVLARNFLDNNKFFGIVIQDGDGNADGNWIHGGGTGIAVVADAVDTTGTLRGNRIFGTTAAPVREIECCGYTATALQS